ncbi:MAG: endonuclease/exonuclease/phosphatase family protein [Clostridia bacterium]|nr:endonuclease/exonuclease/phosphatase family protein [Clostridia bacterium]
MKTTLSFLCQNLWNSGNQKGIQGERGGGPDELYSRSRRFRELVRERMPDVIFGQEGKAGWVLFLEKDPFFNEHYTMIYKWDDSNTCRGKFNERGKPMYTCSCVPILFRRDKFQLLDSGYFWYGETPDRPSYPFADTSHYRICTWVKLREKETGLEFYNYSIHIHNDAHLGGTAGTKALEQLQKEADSLPEGSLAFFGGDYNILYRDPVYQGMDWARLADLRDEAKHIEKEGHCTAPDPTRSNWRDHLFIKPHPHIGVKHWGFERPQYAIPEENVESGRISDHASLFVDVVIDTEKDYTPYQKTFKEE